MKILIKRNFVIKIKRFLYLLSVILPLTLIPVIIFYIGHIYLDSCIKKESAPIFTFNAPKPLPQKEISAENDRDSILNYHKEVIPEDIFSLATPDPSRKYYEVKETNASKSSDKWIISVNDSTNSDTDLNEFCERDFAGNFADYELFSEEPLVLIYHTHTSESFEQSFRGFYYEDDIFRTEDTDKNVCEVGEAMKNILEKNGIKVIHDTTFHDVPAYNGAYSRSKETILKNLEKYPSIKITIDLHRDAMISDSGISYKPTAKIEGKKAAQMMLIAGCDINNEIGFDNWEECLPFSLNVQKTAESLYPNLMRPLMFCRRNYNTYITSTSLLIEVGTQSNTLNEAVYSGKLMGNILSQVIIENLK